MAVLLTIRAKTPISPQNVPNIRAIYQKPFKKYHKSGFTVSFMHFLRQIVLLLSQPRLA
jgi:hypothetical protein